MCCFRTNKNLFLIFSIFKIIVNVESKGRNHNVDFLVDFIGHLNYSNRVITHLCWQKADLVVLSKALQYKFVSHRFLNNIPPNNVYELNHGHTIFILDTSCKGSLNLITKSIRNNLFDPTYTWIIFGKLNKIKSHNFNFPKNSFVYIVEKDTHSHFFVKIICKYNNRYSHFVEVNITEWEPQKTFLYFNKFSLTKNRTNFMGSPIRVSYVASENDTLNHLLDYRFINTDKVTKANYVIVSHLIDLLNATKVDLWANTWGYKNEVTKLYDGMYGDLMSDRADITGTPGFFQVSRLNHFKFIPPTSPAITLFIFQAPPLSYTSNIFILPFSTPVWTTFFLLVILSTVLIYTILITEWKLGINGDNRVRGTRPSAMDVILLECATVTQRGNSLEPKSFSGQIAMHHTTLLCLYMYTGFAGYIVVLLQSTSESITDVGTLYNSKLEIGVEDTPYNRYYFTTPNEQSNETNRKLFYENRIAPNNNWFTTKEGVERVRRGFFAFHVEIGAAYSLIMDTFKENEKCKIRGIYTIFTSGDIFTAVPRNSMYTEFFLIGFRRIFETGLQKREHQKFFAKKPQCLGRQGNYDSVRFLDCYFPFLILGSGFFISLLILTFEIAANKANYHKF